MIEVARSKVLGVDHCASSEDSLHHCVAAHLHKHSRSLPFGQAHAATSRSSHHNCSNTAFIASLEAASHVAVWA